MRQILSNPQAIVVICFIVALVLSINMVLLAVLRGDKSVQAEASKWTKALGGGSAGRRRQAGQYDELRQAVAKLNVPPGTTPPDESDSDPPHG